MRSEKRIAERIAVLLAAGIAVVSARAADPESGRRVVEANRLVATGKYDEAFKIYDNVGEKVIDSPELAYNRGVAYYRKGDRAKAVEQFTKALLTRDIRLEARTKFNLGNCAYADALDKQGNVKEALEKLKLAISHYKEAIAADSNDQDAKVNIETAQLLMKHLLDQEKKKQEEEKKKKEEQKKNPQSQPESQPASQPEQQPQSQPSSQPDSGKDKQDQKQGDQKKDQPKQGDQKNEDQKQADQQKQGEKKDGQQAKDEQGKKLESQQQEGKADKDKKDGKEEQAAAQPVEVREMSKEEAEKLLQMVRDREKQRREAQMLLLRGQPVPVDKDW